MNLLLDAVGWIGAGLLVLGYGMVSTGRMSGDRASYQVVNLVGSVALMANSAYNDAWPSAGLNLVWAGIGVVSLVKLTRMGVAR
ncbi:hypothetical protein ACGF0J_36565 [Nonomuraea sp. NPDC047897]|uniref:CBU_0592 family membrane protein n=1 Tax=Nonomuraea sp. NPDC047897 TaxID=3364346 RepID=UPI003722AB2C